MTSRDLVIAALNHAPAERVPRDLWPSPELAASRSDDLAEIEVRFPADIVAADFKHPPGKQGKGKPRRGGSYTDAWGCTWRVPRGGGAEQLENPPLADAAKIDEYTPPVELVEDGKSLRARLAAVNRQCADSSRFVLAESLSRPLERLCALRGRETALADLLDGAKPTLRLLDMLHEFFCREMQMWAATDVDGVTIGDDLATADGMRIDPGSWREHFRGLVREYCQILQASDKFVFFRSSGDISRIFGDLVRLEVDAIHGELSGAEIERLAKRYRGRVAFWGEVERAGALADGTPQEVRDTVDRARRALDFGSGGLIAQCGFTPDVPFSNVVAFFEQWLLPMPMHA